MSDQTSFVTALYGAILAGAGGGATGTGSYAVLEWPSLPIDQQQYGNLWATDNQSGSAEALEAFSDLVDDNLPLLSPNYQPSGISLEKVYALILGATVGPATSGTSPVAQAFAGSLELFQSVVRGSLADPLVKFHPSYPKPRNWCDPSGEPLWTTMKIGGGVAPPPPPPPKLRVVLERAELPSWRIMSTPIVKAAPRPEVRLAAMATADQRSRATLQSMTALRDVRIVSRGLQPPALQSGQAAVTVAPPLLARLTKPSIVLNPSPPSGTNQPPVRNQPVAAPQLTATFQFLRVSIQRRWLDTTLFHLPGWLLGGISPGMFSNGSIEGNTGIFPLLPVEFVAVKQIRISGTWSEGDKQAASAALTAGSSASFGPFTLTQGDAVHGAFDGSSLTIPGIHILAWLCTPVPFLPPRQ